MKTIDAERGKDGFGACACWDRHASIGWKRSGFLAILLTSILTAAVFLPYITAMARNAMAAFLPFISQAGGSPPMTGALAVPLIFLGITAVLPFIILYESINHRNVDTSKIIFWSNRLALFIMMICCLGCIITSANPIGYIGLPNKFEWVFTVLLEHCFGAVMVLVGASFYQFLLTLIWWYMPDATRKAKYLKLAFSASYMLLFFISIKPMPDTLREHLGPDVFDFDSFKRTKAELPLEFSTSYQISSVCEWLICLLTGLQFLSLYWDAQRISFRIVVRHKSCYQDSRESSPKSRSAFL